MKYKKMKIKIKQGSSLVNRIFIEEQTKNIVCFVIDMISKYCELSAWGNDKNDKIELYICDTDNSLFLHKNKTNFTEIVLKDYKDSEWSVFSATSSKYTINVCLVKNERRK